MKNNTKLEKTGTHRKIGELNYNGNYANPWAGRHTNALSFEAGTGCGLERKLTTKTS